MLVAMLVAKARSSLGNQFPCYVKWTSPQLGGAAGFLEASQSYTVDHIALSWSL